MSTLQRAFIEEVIEDFLTQPEHNTLGPGTTGKAWDGFLLGFSSGADDLYSFWKDHIGDFHWTPAEAFALGKGVASLGAKSKTDRAADPDELTVISIAVYPPEATKLANRAQTRFPSELWARTRVFGHRALASLLKTLVTSLETAGGSGVAPMLLRNWAEHDSPSYGPASSWSERHVAYTSGLGTFGFCGGLITEKGKAVRLGSVIVRADIPPTPRPYSGPFEYCLHYTPQGCTGCSDRCPAGSVSEQGRDKTACAKHLEPRTRDFVRREYGFDGYGCGLCQTGVPCESGIPTA